MKTVMKTIILFAIAVVAMASCSKKEPQEGFVVCTYPIDSIQHSTDTVKRAGTSVEDRRSSSAPKAEGSFNGVSSRSSDGHDEILGFDDDVDDDNDMDAFMLDYHD